MPYARRFRILYPAVLGLAAALGVIEAASALAAEGPVAVSPGDATKVAVVESRCPTFSWGAVSDAKSYELVVYRLGDGVDKEPVLRETFAGSVNGWTPSLDLCLERGGQYAWSVRAQGEKAASEWSMPSLFEVASGPSEAEFERAVEVVRTYLAAEESEQEPNESPKASARSANAGSGAQGAAGRVSAPVTGQPAAAQPVPLARVAPSITSLVTEGAVGVGIAAPLADLHVAGTPSLSSVLVSPSQSSQGKAELILAEEPGGNYGIKFVYDGGPDVLEIFGMENGVEFGPHLTMGRNSGKMTFGASCIGRRWLDQGDGTVLDCNTRLVWLKDASCFGTGTWGDSSTAGTVQKIVADFNSGAASYGCADYTQLTHTDWRVPEIEEFCRAGEEHGNCPVANYATSMVDTRFAGSPKVSNAAGNAKWTTDGDPFVGVQTSFYWSNTQDAAAPDSAWLQDFFFGSVVTDLHAAGGYVWPVRSGQ